MNELLSYYGTETAVCNDGPTADGRDEGEALEIDVSWYGGKSVPQRVLWSGSRKSISSCSSLHCTVEHSSSGAGVWVEEADPGLAARCAI